MKKAKKSARASAIRGACLAASALIAICVMPATAPAQGVPEGAARGAEDGGHAAGPLGAVVGGVVGGVAGGVAGILGVDQRPRFREYVVQQHRPSYHYEKGVSVGVELPSDGVEYYDVPEEYGARGYRYTVIDGRSVLVDPRTRRVVEVLD